MNSLSRSMLLLVVLVLVASSAVAGECRDYASTVPFTGVHDLPTDQIVLHGDHLITTEYCGPNRCLAIYDLTDPAIMPRVGLLDDGTYPGDRFKVYGDTLFGVGPGRINLFDIADPTAPRRLNSWRLNENGSGFYDFAYRDGLLYVAYDWQSLRVYDVNRSAQPILIEEIFLERQVPRHLMIWDTHLICVANEHLLVFDLTNPRLPQLVHTTEEIDGRIPHGLRRVGNFLLTWTTGSLVVFDFSDRENPILAHRFDGPIEHAFTLDVRDDRALLTDLDVGIQVLDLSELPQIRLVQTIESVHLPYDALLWREQVIVRDHSRTITIIDPSQYESVDPLVQATETAFLWNMTYRDGLIYGGAFFHGEFRILRAQPDGRVVPIGESEYIGKRFQLQGDFAFLVGDPLGFVVLDVSDLYHPQYAAHLDLPNTRHQMGCSGKSIYTYQESVFDDETISKIDVSDPYTPRLVAVSPPLPDRVYDLQADDKTFYYTTYDSHELIAARFHDATGSDSQPQFEILDSVDLQKNFGSNQILIAGDMLILYGWRVLWMFDCHDPSDLHLVASYVAPVAGSINTAILQDEILYLTVGSGVVAVDMADPLNPRTLGFLRTGDYRSSLVVGGGYLWGATQSSVHEYVEEISSYALPCEAQDWTPSEDHVAPVAESLHAISGLGAIYPVPANPRVRIECTVPATGSTQVSVYDLKGRRVRDLAVPSGAGLKILDWDGTNSRGDEVASGVYLVRMRTDAGTQTKRVVLIR